VRFSDDDDGRVVNACSGAVVDSNDMYRRDIPHLEAVLCHICGGTAGTIVINASALFGIASTTYVLLTPTGSASSSQPNAACALCALVQSLNRFDIQRHEIRSEAQFLYEWRGPGYGGAPGKQPGG
jgi:hypothetical protein